jgi:immunoglobulin-binding protein 1
MLKPAHDEETQNDESLSSIFANLKLQLSKTDDYSPQDQILQVLSSLQTCDKMIRQLSMFSSNELIEDVSTSDLQYLLCSYMLGDTYLKLNPTDPDRSLKRMQILKDAKMYLDSFIDLCDSYGLLNSFHSALLAQLKSDSKVPYEEKRTRKIEAFKRTLELNKILDVPVSDEDANRELQLSSIELALLKSIDHLKSIQDELEMINFSLERETLEKMKGLNVDSRVEPRKIDNKTALLSADGKVQRNFVITSKREQFKDGVFRYGHNLPTMSIEEFLDKEIERGNFLSQKDNAPIVEVESDDEGEVFKARQMDDFKDANPRGWGNRMNKG